MNVEKLKKIDLLRICKFLKVPSDISIELFDYNGTTIKTNKEEDLLIRGLLRSNMINSLKKVNEAINLLGISE